jgi:hypothetical protein
MSLTKVTYSMIEGTPINIVDMGAVGDGVTDNTAVIQAALNLNLTTYRPIYFPVGVYLVASPLTFLVPAVNPNTDYVPCLTMFGDNAGAVTNPDVVDNTQGSIIKTTMTSGTFFNVESIPSALLTPVQLSNLQFLGPDRVDPTGPTTTVNGLRFSIPSSGTSSGVKMRLDNVCVSGFGGTGVELNWVENSLISALTCNYCGIGLLLKGATNANVFNYLEVQENWTAGLKIETGIGNSFLTPLIQGNKKTGLWIQGAESTAFVAPYFEGNNYVLDANSYSIYVRNPGDGITLVNNVTISNAIVNTNNSGTNNEVYVDSNGGNAYTIDSLVFTECRGRQNTVPNMIFTGQFFNNCAVSGGFSLSLLNGAIVSTQDWKSWTPTIGNATANVGATSKFKYRAQGKAVELYIELDNYNVTSNGEITVSSPSFLNYYGPLYAIDRRSGTNIFAFYDANTQQIRIAKSFGVNWTSGDTTGAIIQGTYPIIF